MITDKQMANDLYAPKALLTSWSANRERSVQDIQWDLCIAPMLTGPLAVLDNMVCDNAKLYEFLQNENHEKIFNQYVADGRLQLWHRQYHQPQQKIQSVEDILMNWLCRTEEKSIDQVEFGMLNSVGAGDANRELRKRIRKWNSNRVGRKERLDGFYGIMRSQKEFTDYVKYLKILNKAFFESPHAQAAKVFKNNPLPIEVRFIHALGIDDAEGMLAQCRAGKKKLKDQLLRYIVLKNINTNPYITVADIEEFVSHKSTDGFFEYLSSVNPTVTELQSLLKSVPSKLSQAVDEMLITVYDTAIPEANNAPVLIEKRGDEEPDPETFKKGMADVVSKIQTVLKEQEFKGLFAGEDEGKEARVEKLNLMMKYLVTASPDPAPRWFSGALTASTAVTLFTVGNIFRHQLEPFIKENSYQLMILQTLVSLTGILGQKPINKAAGFLYPRIFGSNNGYMRMKPDFYKNGLIKIDSMHVVQLRPMVG